MIGRARRAAVRSPLPRITDSTPWIGPPSNANAPLATHIVTVVWEALKHARTQGLRSTNSSATAVLTATIHIDGPCPHSTAVASPALEAMLTVPDPESVVSHRLSEIMQITTQAR